MTDFIWSRVRNAKTDKPVGTFAHIIDTEGGRKTLCGVGVDARTRPLGVSPDATLKVNRYCGNCETTHRFHPEVVPRGR